MLGFIYLHLLSDLLYLLAIYRLNFVKIGWKGKICDRTMIIITYLDQFPVQAKK